MARYSVSINTSHCSILINIALGITEAVILAETKESHNACGPGVWYCILAWCIWRFLSACVVTPREIQVRRLHANGDVEAGYSIKKYSNTAAIFTNIVRLIANSIIKCKIR